MRKGIKLVLTLLLVLMVVALSACKEGAGEESSGDGPITLKMLVNWNGGSGPKDMVNNPVAKKITEETGVIIEQEYVTGSEIEKINQIFATGSMPDIYTGPAWGDAGEILLKAANEGQLHDLTKYIEKYPNLAELVKKENMSGDIYDVISKQNGGQFMLHTGYPAETEDIVNWLYGLYVNKDIAKKVGIDPQSVHTPDELYDFLQAVRDEDLKANGKPVFPLGAGAGGWPLDILSEMFVPVAGASSWMIEADGNAKLNFMTDEYQSYILYMRTLLTDGLLDPEAYTQTGTVPTEKFAQERYAVVPNQFDGMYTEAEKAGIQDKFVPLGPLNDFTGDPYRTEVNVTGSDLIAIPKTVSEEKLDAVMRAINYLTSDEGYLLTHYGMEGVHYDMVDGKVQAKEKWIDKLKEDPDALKNEGIDVYSRLSGLGRSVSLGGGNFGYQYDERYEAKEKFEEIMSPDGIKPIEGKDPNIVVKEHENDEQLEPIFTTLGDVVLQAIYADTEEKAISLINESREALKRAGIEDVAKEISKQAKEGTEFMRYRTSN